MKASSLFGVAAILALVACAPTRDPVEKASDQNASHLARVQALRLDSISRSGIVVYFSKGRGPRGEAVFAIVDGMLTHFRARYGALGLRVAVLDQSDWKASVENPYGVPGVRHPGPIAFMPADVDQGSLYRDVFGLADGLPAMMKARVDTACGSLGICTSTFADLIVLHEIAHVYVDSSFGRPNLWLGEFAPDYLVYGYLRSIGGAKLTAWNVMNEVIAQMPPRVSGLEQLELQRNEPLAFETLAPELPRLDGILMELIPQVYDQLGSSFLARLATEFPRDAQLADCPPDGLSAGICKSNELPESEVLLRLGRIAPGFDAWWRRYGVQWR